MTSLTQTLSQLSRGQRIVVYTAYNGDEITATRTGWLSSLDFVIQIEKKNGSKIKIPHTRLFSDLNKKLTCNKQDADTLFCIIEEVNKGKDPKIYLPKISGLSFTNQIDDADVNAYCTQLMMIEQELNYGPQGKKSSVFTPPREFFMHYIRWVYSQDKPIKYINSQVNGRKIPPRTYNQPITCDDI